MDIHQLEGHALDWAVARAVKDESVTMWGDAPWTTKGPYTQGGSGQGYKPSTDWSQGGPLLERFPCDVRWDGVDGDAHVWYAQCEAGNGMEYFGGTFLVAVCRAIVASQLGDEVNV